MSEIKSVRLVSYSQPSEEFNQEGLDDIQDLVSFSISLDK